MVHTWCARREINLPTDNLIMPKSVLVTGATGLLGRQVVIAFEREGWTVTGTGYSRAKPPSILKVDLGSETEVTKVLEEVK